MTSSRERTRSSSSRFARGMLIAISLISLALGAQALADSTELSKPFLHPLFTDNMVLERDTAAPVWGWTTPGAKVTVRISGLEASGTGDAAGAWVARIGPIPAGGPYVLTVDGPKQVTVNNVLVGDVWLCAGQSNMQKPVGPNPPQMPIVNYEQEIAQADYPTIRLFDVEAGWALVPQSTCRGTWQVCSPKTVAAFSAAAYFFARDLVREDHVPIGIITASMGGTLAQAWTSLPALKATPTYRGYAKRTEDLRALAKQDTLITPAQIDGLLLHFKKHWWLENDPGLRPGKEWTAVAYDASAWKPMKLLQSWHNAGLENFEGMVWFRKAVELPEGWNADELVFSVDGFSEEGSVYFNGTNVSDNRFHQNPDQYKIPAGLVRPGKNVLAIRAVGTRGGYGMTGDANHFYLALAKNEQTKIPLSGEWLYQVGIPLKQVGAFPSDSSYFLAGANFNAMIAPLFPYSLKGFAWYQGESDIDQRPYRDVLTALIGDWRAGFGQGELPFLIVQLPNVGAPVSFPASYTDHYAKIREAQLATVLHVPNTGLVITIDIGEPDIHPTNKQDVGKRMALSAQGLAYSKKIEFCGPLYAGMDASAGKVRLRFLHTGAGLATKDGAPLTGFAIAGADKQLVLADAVIDGDTVIVSSAKVPQPTIVHYATQSNPICNLCNKAGLPASPFRTDCAETRATADKAP